MDSAVKIAEALIEIGAVGFTPHAPITFKSGMRSPIYIDNRQIPFYPQIWRLVIDGFEALINEQKLKADVIAGIETAGIPHGSALAYQSQRSSVFVRKQEKEHGAKKRVEGGDVSGKNILLVEDHITTGGSSLAGIEALRHEGAIVEHCLAITSYGFPEASAMFNTAGVTLHVLVTLPTILEAARAKSRFGDAELVVLHDWAHDPYGWAERQGFAE